MVRRIIEIAKDANAQGDPDLTFYQNKLRSILEGYGQGKKMEKMYSSALKMSAWLSTNPALLNRTQVGMNQLNRLVDGGFLERLVLQTHGRGNVVRGE